MIVKMFVVGSFSTNCYVVSCEQSNEAIIVDPGFDTGGEAEKIFKFIEENALDLKFILNTHGHPDHTCGNGTVKDKFDVPILIHEYDAHMLGRLGEKSFGFFDFEHSSPPADALLNDGNVVTFGKAALKVIHTPGHTRGGISLLGQKEVFTGDTLFYGSIGRTDFPESSEKDMRLSLKKLSFLPDCFIVYPGHGLTTKIGEEKCTNPFLQAF